MIPFLSIALISLTIILSFWALIDMVKTRRNVNPIWLILILFFPIFGSILYFQMKKEHSPINNRFNPRFNR